ncbi:MAG: ribosome small subunit-dependent GTPase A, partial [Bacteroidota bacterium]
MQGKVIKSVGSAYHVQASEGQVYVCQLRGRLRLSSPTTTNLVNLASE